MGCRSEYLEPNDREEESKRVAEFLVILYIKYDEAVPNWIRDASKAVYGDQDRVDTLTALLCAMCETYEDDIYKSLRHEPELVPIIAWWVKHQEIDLARELHDAQQRQEDALRESGLAKLTPEEQAALGITSLTIKEQAAMDTLDSGDKE
jgi:hypothetical protein